MGSARAAARERLITSEPLKGTPIPVEVATHVAGTLEFVSGAVVSIAMSFDVPKHRHTPIEIYGTEGTMCVPDPNRFGGVVELAKAGEDWEDASAQHGYADGNYRIIGVADMAPPCDRARASGQRGAGLHVLEVMEAFQISSDRAVTSRSRAAPSGPPCCRRIWRSAQLD